jgi:RimJ/RimL family protein N-acetyltransferase
VKKLFFSPEFKAEFQLKDGPYLRVGSVLPESRHKISNGLKDMSSASIRNRFLGSKKEFSEKELKYLTILDGWNHYGIGVEECGGKCRGVAVIRLVRSHQFKGEAEVAITIIDDFQGKGLGSILMNLIILAAHERDIHRLSFSFLPQNEAIQKLIRKVGTPLIGTQTHDFVQLYLNLKTIDIKKIKSDLEKIFPEIVRYE